MSAVGGRKPAWLSHGRLRRRVARQYQSSAAMDMRSSILAGGLLALLCAPACSLLRPAVLVKPRLVVLNTNARGDAIDPALNMGSTLTQDARALLARKGFQVIDGTSVEVATDLPFAEAQQAALSAIARTNRDADALYIDFEGWHVKQNGMVTDDVMFLVAATVIDAERGQIVWQANRIYETRTAARNNVGIAQGELRQLLAPLAPSRETNPTATAQNQ